jgi:hypothetical protein
LGNTSTMTSCWKCSWAVTLSQVRNSRTVTSCRKCSWAVTLSQVRNCRTVTSCRKCYRIYYISYVEYRYNNELWLFLIHTAVRYVGSPSYSCHLHWTYLGDNDRNCFRHFYVVGIIVRCVPYVVCQKDLKSQQSNHVCF